MKVEFTDHYAKDHATFGINFQALVGGSCFVCNVSPEALQDIDPGNRTANPEEQFVANRAAFERIAECKIRAGKKSPIMITSGDVCS